MPRHYWGDEDFDWTGLWYSVNYCCHVWSKWGRIGTHGKEKYGAFRDHIIMWDGGIWSLFYPGYVWVKPGFWHFIYFYVDRYFVIPFTWFSGLQKIGLWYQAQVYNYAVQKMCKKYPHLINEIVSSLDGYKMVKPGIFGKVCGEKIRRKYWAGLNEKDD